MGLFSSSAGTWLANKAKKRAKKWVGDKVDQAKRYAKKKVKQGVKYAKEQIKGAINDTIEGGRKLRAKLTNSNSLKGERHMMLMTKKDGLRVANYAGPGTQIVKRLRSNDPRIREPVSEMDRISMAHDIRYGLAKTLQDGLKADRIFKNAGRRVRKSGKDNIYNTQAVTIIAAKNKLGKIGLLNEQKLLGGKYSEEDTKLLKNKLKQLERMGY